MNRSDQDRLLQEIFAGEGGDARRRATLECSLRVMRRRRRARRLLAGGLAAAIVAALVSVALHPRKAPQWAPVVAGEDRAPAAFTYIGDEELRVLLADRSYALIGPPGRQQFVFLDKPESGPW